MDLRHDYTFDMPSPYLPPRGGQPVEDHFVVLRGSWADYERLLQIRGDHSAPRIAYFEGAIEIMSPSISHEAIKSILGCLVEAWCLERDIEFSTFGSWTLKKKKEESGVEPDECYVIGEYVRNPKRPDLAIEVVWTGGGIEKLQIYRRLGVREVWFWDSGRITLYRLRRGAYQKISRSETLPGIDLRQLASFVSRKSTSRLIRAYRAALRGKRRKKS